MGTAEQVSLQCEPRLSRIFISYASQNLPISAMCLQKSLLINGFCRQDLADLLNEIEEHVRPINSVLIRGMAEKLQTMVNESELEAPRTESV
jgi:hypothetical protein